MDKLQAKRCSKCGYLMYPLHVRCPKCKGTRFEDFELENGRLLTYTVLYATPEGVQKPLYLGIVEFQGGVRAIGQLSPGAFEAGDRMVAEKVKLREKDGKTYTGFRFRKLDGP